MAAPVPQHNPQVCSETLELTWNIPNFLEVRKAADKINQQQRVFELGKNIIGMRSKWRCYMLCEKMDNQNWIALYLNAMTYPPNVDKIQTSCEFKLPYKNPNKANISQIFKFDREVYFTASHWGFSKAISQDGQLQGFELKKNGDFEIKVIITISKPVISTDTALSNLSSYWNTFTSNLCSDLDKMYNNHLQTNHSHIAKIRSKDGKEFPVNRAILAARSSVFEALFLQNINQAQNEIVQISDISSEPLNVLLNFMHTGKLQECWKNENIIEELVYAAYKYGQKDLLEYFDQALGYVCTNKNCGKLMSLVRQLGLKTAEGRLMEYFKSNITEIGQVIQFAKDAEKNWVIKQEAHSLAEWVFA